MYNFKHALITAHLCKPCSIKYICDCKKVNEKEIEKDNSKKICKKCNKGHIYCKNKNCNKACMRFKCNWIICENCKDEEIECKRTIIRNQNEFNNLKEKCVLFCSGKFEKGKETNKLHEQLYFQFDKSYNIKKIKEILENGTVNIQKKYFGRNEDMSAINMKNYSIKKYPRCVEHEKCRCSYNDINNICKLCNENCKQYRLDNEIKLKDKKGNIISDDEVGPFIFGNFNSYLDKDDEEIEVNNRYDEFYSNYNRNEFVNNNVDNLQV